MTARLVETDPAIAKKIMGPDCITLEEVLSIFPCPKEYLEEIGSVPFSPGTLYDCSEPNNRHILIPGVYRVGQHPLTITTMRAQFPEHRPFFGHWDGLVASVISSLTVNTCRPAWYLISKNSFSNDDILSYSLRQDLPKDETCGEYLVVYIYAWLLMKRLRNEAVFGDRPFYCIDKPNFGNYHVSLRCSKDELKIIPFFINPKSGAKHRYANELSYVPALWPDEEPAQI